ncbi:hypothetical protein V8G54_023973 [Vigna mungo]|uniref:DNA-directed RNA polymerase n=1 Tax=Vigna mungo TaxID=3915 RepID=A0AAQ3RQV5_VIGMU
MAERTNLMFHNKVIGGTAIKRLISRLIDHFGMAYTSHILDQVKTLGFRQATATSISLGIDDLLTIPSKGWLVRDAEHQNLILEKQHHYGNVHAVEKLRQSIEIWYATSEYFRQEMNPNFRMTDPFNPVHIMSFSGARGNASQVHQLVGMRGLMSDPQGQMIDLPIQSNLREGLSLTEYIISCYGARKGVVDTAVRTSDAGYLTRRLVEVVQHIVIRRTDCGTIRGISVNTQNEMMPERSWTQTLIGRVLADDIYRGSRCIAIRNQDIGIGLFNRLKTFQTQPISIRTPFTCRNTSWICRLCYGQSPTQGHLVELGEAVGIIAGQSIGEPGTQLTLRTFHTGGVFTGGTAEQGIYNITSQPKNSFPVERALSRNMGEVAEAQYFRSEIALLNYSDASLKPPLSPLLIHIDPLTPSDSSSSEAHPSPSSQLHQQEQHPKDAWLPITESRNGNAFSAAFHVLNSNIGFQALMLPVAFATLGWVWGTVCLTVAFIWQLYSIFLLVELHESVPGIRHSRYLFLAMAAFGKRLGKVAALFPVMYLSGGTCVMLIITGGGTLQLLFKTLCENDDGNTCSAYALTGAEWFLVFTCAAILVAQLPNLNSMAMVSLVGAVAAISYCTLFWVLSVKKGRPNNVSYTSTLSQESTAVAKINDVLNAIGIIVLAYRGHNVLLEIQARDAAFRFRKNIQRTNAQRSEHVVCSDLHVRLSSCNCRILGLWKPGKTTRKPTNIPRLRSYQIYAMPVFDNLEIRLTSITNERCSGLARTCIRLFFGGLTFFIAVTFPFLPSLSALLGSMTLVPITYAYPCFMFLSLKKPRPRGFVWCFNAALGCLGLLLSALLLAAAARTLSHRGLNANFFRP